eukprot:PhM_4_TR5966/c1_g2_i2/m.3888
MVVMRTLPRLVGWHRNCSLIVPSGTHIPNVPTLCEHSSASPSFLMAQVTVVTARASRTVPMYGKCFPVGPRHICMTLHQLVAPAPYTASAVRVGGQYYVLPKFDPAAAEDKKKDFVFLEVDAPAKEKPFERWLYPAAPDPSKPVYCPVSVPIENIVGELMPSLIKAWDDQGVVVPRPQDEIEEFFSLLGRPGDLVTLQGPIARATRELLGVRVSTWSTQCGGFITQDKGKSSHATFCGIMCCSGTADKTSNFNTAVAATNKRFMKQYEQLVVPALPTVPLAVRNLLNKTKAKTAK